MLPTRVVGAVIITRLRRRIRQHTLVVRLIVGQVIGLLIVIRISRTSCPSDILNRSGYVSGVGWLKLIEIAVVRETIWRGGDGCVIHRHAQVDWLVSCGPISLIQSDVGSRDFGQIRSWPDIGSLRRADNIVQRNAGRDWHIEAGWIQSLIRRAPSRRPS